MYLFGSDKALMKDVRDEIFKISSKMDVISERNRNADAIHLDHEGRIRNLERWRYSIPLSAVTSAAAIIVAVLHK